MGPVAVDSHPEPKVSQRLPWDIATGTEPCVVSTQRTRGAVGKGGQRNEPCWCGSGRKYKACHLNREHEAPTNLFAVQTKFRKSSPKVCLHPDQARCSGAIVQAHTIQRTGAISAIADSTGHVLGLDLSLDAVTRNGGRVGVKRIGVRQASTFTGFCSHHDSETFAPIERNPFVACPEHCFLLAYRGHCRELYQRTHSLDSWPLLQDADTGVSPALQALYQSMLGSVNHSAGTGLDDMLTTKAAFDDRLVRQDYSDTGYYVVRFDQTPDVMTSFAIFPEMDFQGNQLQDLATDEVGLDSVSVSLIGTDGGAGALVLSWINETRAACTDFAKSLHMVPDQELPSAVVRLVFEFAENTFLRPAFWQALDEKAREALISRFTTAVDLTSPSRRLDTLAEDGNKYASWHVVARETNLSL